MSTSDETLVMIGERIRELRETNGILLRELAAEVDVDPAVLSKMLRHGSATVASAERHKTCLVMQ